MYVSHIIIDIQLSSSFMHNWLNLALHLDFNIVLIKWGDTWRSTVLTWTFIEKCSVDVTPSHRVYTHKC